MTVKQICTLPENVLRQKAKKVSIIDKSIQRLIDDMIKTMHQSKGIGLAAPQIGVSLRVVVLKMPEEEEHIVLINPEVVKRSGEREIAEACLSVPGYSGEIKRAEKVTVKGLDRKGQKIRIRATGIMAQALEHELDHLNGTLYIDHIEDETKLHKIEPKKEGENEVTDKEAGKAGEVESS